MKKISLSLALIAILTIGCSAPKAKKLDDGSALYINNSILEKQYNFVPKDQFLSSSNWTYQIIVEKKSIEDDFIKNDLITKAFLLAHNASKIILVGREDLIREYKDYFIKNQVIAPIELQPINPYPENINKVSILFFNKVTKGD
ncbi:cag pathogenicity island protein [Campylobacter jejuni]|uniref:cag pathogenicity island Cag12 family protein n=1 Tax=Campylobacter TaxID=194 RepID=UPI00073DBE3B|nr:MULTISPECIES: cag pathogenicity island Cag12 family protein [Campylobacter]ALW49318.1 cag pathogenicity island protein [Campylobacter jejuni]ALW65292.1 cag pathogenicity island protein [Campylobacter jejuni]ALW68525.1 cag pathogenicity island protein [Campylobacter jejuni]EAK8099012.1 cag pathogenicity island protein [Campylobacter jejuni]EAL0578666.1 cag pathogenicity island protein [Campylobacter jejuni]